MSIFRETKKRDGPPHQRKKTKATRVSSKFHPEGKGEKEKKEGVRGNDSVSGNKKGKKKEALELQERRKRGGKKNLPIDRKGKKPQYYFTHLKRRVDHFWATEK